MTGADYVSGVEAYAGRMVADYEGRIRLRTFGTW